MMLRRSMPYLLSLLLLLSLPRTIFGDAGIPTQLPLTEVEGDPSGMIADCVSVISGAYQEAEEDIVIPGVDRLSYQRIYCSLDWGGDTLCDSWTYNHAQNVYLTRENKLFSIIATEPSGGAASYWGGKTTHKGRGEERLYTPPDHPVAAKIIVGRDTGLTNTSSGVISGATNLRNQTLHFDPNGDFKVRGALPNGGFRNYQIDRRSSDSLPQKYLLHQEIHPSGNQFKYSYVEVGYDKRRRHGTQTQVNSIEAWNAAETYCFGFLHFDYSGCVNSGKNESNLLKVRAHDGREASYLFSHVQPGNPRDKRRQHRWNLVEVKRPNGPTVQYDHLFHEPWSASMVNKKIVAGRTVRALNYYTIGSVVENVDLEKIENNSIWSFVYHDHPCEKRVKQLLAPVGLDDTPVITHRFAYEPQHTDVRDAYNHRTSYRYSLEQRLTAIEHYLGSENHTLYSLDKLFWGNPKTEQGSELQSRAICYPDGTVRSCRWLEYDSNRNVIAEHILGNLSGQQTLPVELDANGIPLDNGSERYTIRRAFTNDRFRLIQSESYPNGRSVDYRYKPGTNLLTAKLTRDNGSVVLREFHDYDGNASMIRTIRDDGSGEHPGDLTHVTLRKVTVITPRTQQPCIGLPEVIEERYWDPVTGIERQLQRLVKHYTREGWCTREEHYDANNSLAYVLTWEHDTYGNVILEQDALGRITTRRFDPFGNKLFEQGPDTSCHIEYLYDYANRLVAESRIGHAGEIHTLSYRYDLRGNKIASIDALGNETTHRYDALNRLIETTLPPCPDVNGNSVRLVSTYEHDISGNITHTVEFDGGVTQKTYNIRSQPTWICHPDGTEERFVYMLDGSLAEHTASNGSVTRYTYNALGKCIRKAVYADTGELLAENQYTYKGHQLIAETDPNGNTTTYIYDGAGRMICKRSPETETTIQYDASGQPVRTTTAISSKPGDFYVKILAFDLLKRPLEERIEDASGTLFKRTVTTYDAAGHVYQLTTWNERGPCTLQTEYDFMGRVCRITDAKGNETLTHYGDAINACGQRVLQVTQVDALGRSTQTTQDPLGRSHTVVKADSYGTVLSSHSNIYDGKGRLTHRSDLVKTEGQPDRPFVTEWKYDSNGHVVELIQGSGTPQRRQTFYTYDKAGQKKSEMAPDGMELRYTYDAAGRLSQMTASDGTIDYTYAYDPKGNLLHVHDAVHNIDTTRSYDNADRMISETLGNSLTLNSDYDGLGRLVKLELPDHSSVTWTYDAAFMRSVNRYNSAGQQQYSHAYLSYDLSGHAQRMQMIGHCGEMRQEWDELSRPTLRECPQYKEEIPEGGYDAVGNLVKASRRDLLGDVSCAYGYNGRDQLCEEDTYVSHRYAYDSLDNRLQKDDQNCVIDALNQLLQQGDAKYGYDERGNRVSQVKDDVMTRFAFDALGRLIEAIREDVRCVYRYDSFNRRLSKTTYNRSEPTSEWRQEDTERYLYQAQMDIGMVDAVGTVQQFRALGEGLGAEIAAAVAIEVQGTPYAPIHNFQGHIVALADFEDGHVVQAYRYTAFGEETIHPEERPISPWRFSSKRTDSETGLVYFGRRYFDPDTARWLTPDPTGHQDGPNLYAYVHNSPLTHIDLYGLWAIGWDYQDGPFIEIYGYRIAPFSEQCQWQAPVRREPSRPRTNDQVYYPGFETATRSEEDYSYNYESECDEEWEFGHLCNTNGIRTNDPDVSPPFFWTQICVIRPVRSH